MPTAAKAYVAAVITASAVALPLALSPWSGGNWAHLGIFLVLAVLASLLKIRLPGVEGNYSFSFFFILIGVCYFTLPETVVVTCAAAVSASIWNTRKRPTLVQILFNVANLILSVNACFLLLAALQAAGLGAHRPVVVAAVACVYFVVNTMLVSGILFLLQGERLAEIAVKWYDWSFPYYLVGVTVVGLLPMPEASVSPESWFLLLPPLYLLHFYFGLVAQGRPERASHVSANPGSLLPRPARLYIAAIIATSLTLLTFGALHWESADEARLYAYLGVAVLTSVFKIRVPRVTGNVSLNFVVLLAAIPQLSAPELTVVAVNAALAQSLWNRSSRLKAVQVVFNAAALVAVASLADAVFHAVRNGEMALGLLPSLFVATTVLYAGNTVVVAVAICLAESRPLGDVCQRCCYWTFPYYLIGAVLAGLMVTTGSVAGWPPTFLLLPIMGLVFVSYRLHVQKSQRVPVTQEHCT